jgi:hypothetical protein
MGYPGTETIPFGRRKNLGFALQPAKRGAVENPGMIAAEPVSILGKFDGVFAAAAVVFGDGVGSQTHEAGLMGRRMSFSIAESARF